MRVSRLRWIVLPLAAALFVAATTRSLQGMDAPGTGSPGPAAELFLERLKGALRAVSETPLRTQVSGQTVLFESIELSTMGTLDAELNLEGDWESLLSVTGPTVDVSLGGGRLWAESGIPRMESIDLKARLDRSSLEIQSFEGLLGGAPFRVMGRIENPATLSENGWVDLMLNGDNLLLYRSEEIRLRAAAGLRLAEPFS
jgi:hypothetical protein